MQRKVFFTLLFALVGLVSIQIPFTRLIGSSVSFTLFDFFGPISGAFLGGPLGVVAVLIVSLANFFINGFAFEPGPVIRLFPALFAVYYFSFPADKNVGRRVLIVPLLAILVFWAHPVGREVWYYALFWTIPIASFFKRDFLFLRSLGATFTAHAVGGAAWIWAFNLPASVWQGLIPVVVIERLLFALGISVSFIIMTNVLAFLTSKELIPPGLSIEKSYQVGVKQLS